LASRRRAGGLLCAQLGVGGLAFAPGEEPFLHPGRAAAVELGGRGAGWLGEIHPLVAGAWGLEGAVGFEIDAASLLAAATAGEEVYAEISEFPSVREDIAVVVPAGVAAEKVVAVVKTAGGDTLRSAEVFDVYTSDRLGEDKVSLALRLEFSASDRTLSDEEVAPLRAAIVAALEAEVEGSLRG
jgi:phenylalanyl-tRNA synthetase beta chain